MTSRRSRKSLPPWKMTRRLFRKSSPAWKSKTPQQPPASLSLWLRPILTPPLANQPPAAKLRRVRRVLLRQSRHGLWLSSSLRRTKRLKLMNCLNLLTSWTTRSTWRITRSGRRSRSSRTVSMRSHSSPTGKNRSQRSGTRPTPRRMPQDRSAELPIQTREAQSPIVSQSKNR